MFNLKINIYKNDIDGEEYYKIEEAKVKRIKKIMKMKNMN
jgi:hypothetical protein